MDRFSILVLLLLLKVAFTKKSLASTNIFDEIIDFSSKEARVLQNVTLPYANLSISHELISPGDELISPGDELISPGVNREDRFIFTLVRFGNSLCTSGGNSGICYTKTECSNIGGTVIGTCARGFGSCCYKQITCGGSSSSNCTYLVSPNYPGTYNEGRTCSMSITWPSNVCQLRMDFADFESIPPDDFGVCNNDQLTVPGERKFTYLCGRSPENWHFYLDVNGKSNPTIFNFLTSATSFNRRFKIKITMVKCTAKVPCGCGQYFTGDTGTINSFNYGNGAYLAGLNYGICFRKEKNRCTTTLTTLGPSFTACQFDLYRLPVGQSNGNSPVANFNLGNIYCQQNLPSSPITQSINKIPSPITTVTNGPLIIWHLTQIDNFANFLNNDNCPTCAGFSQMYTHNPC